MNKTTKKSASKTSQKRVVKDLDVKPGKGGTVRGGIIVVCDQTTSRGKHY